MQNGSILKVAVTKQFREVLEDAVMMWRVNINRVDESDKATVLDFVEQRIVYSSSNKDTDYGRILKEYYKMLRAGGALHRRELTNGEAIIDREENWVCWKDDKVPDLRLCEDKIRAERMKNITEFSQSRY